ncbi:MAG: DNA adenine methylase [Candidatus Ratteibacteria bacterium]|jgi:site-specific DNA-methyltransferase (adenine-specific)
MGRKSKSRASRNRTITIDNGEVSRLKKKLIKIDSSVSVSDIENKTINQDVFQVLDLLPNKFVDLVFVDPPYNLNKTFNLTNFKAMESEKYEEWLDSWVQKIIPLFETSRLNLYLRRLEIVWCNF